MLALRIAFVLLLYLFLYSLVRAVRQDLAVRGSAEQAPRRAAGRPRGRLIVLEGAGAGLRRGQSIPLETEMSIGRAADNELRIDSTLVSARHARLRDQDGRWLIEDLGSTNGTLLNQRPLDGTRAVEYGDVIEIGDVRLKLAR